MNKITAHIRPLDHHQIVKLSAEKATEHHANEDKTLDIYVIEDVTGFGHVVSLSKKEHSIEVRKFFPIPSNDFLNTKINVDNDDLYSSGILNVSDALSSFGERRSKETIINNLLNDKKDYGCSPLIKLVLHPMVDKDKIKTIKDSNIDGQYDELIDTLETMLKFKEKDNSPYNLFFCFVTTSQNEYHNFFDSIGYDSSAVDKALEAEILTETKNMFLFGSQIHKIAVNEGFSNKDNFEYNDCDNHIMYQKDKDDFKCYSLTSQNFHTFIMQSENEFIAIEYAEPIYKTLDGQFENEILGHEDCCIRDVIVDGFMSGWSATTNNCSPNYKPTLEWLNEASADSIRDLKSKSFHCCNNVILATDSHIAHLIWDIDLALSSLCQNIDLDKHNFVKNNGSFSLLASNTINPSSSLNNIQELRNNIFLSENSEYKWHKDGYIYHIGRILHCEDKGMDNVIEGNLIEPDPLSPSSLMLNIPYNAQPDAIEQIELSLQDLKDYAINNPYESNEMEYRQYTENKQGNLISDIAMIETHLKKFKNLNI
jgi:hypothetical protein